ncbi:MAG: hypothetical protein NVV62_01960 [Terricaulis sp.]|nr:hypothetical protein [Terricaulis sp.]
MEACNNVVLHREYGLGIEFEKGLEVPVDLDVARGLRSEAGKRNLKWTLAAWPGVVHLTRDQHAMYQDVASIVAKLWGLPFRYQLDYFLWRPGR